MSKEFSDAPRRELARPAAAAALFCLAMAGCGGGGGSSSTPTAPAPVTTAPTVLPASSTLAERCVSPRPAGTIDPLTMAPYGDVQGTLADEKAWLRSWTDETYLWYQDVEALPASVLAPDGYATAQAYFDALKSPVVTASGKPKDAFHFTETTTEWVDESSSGVTVGYGMLLAVPMAMPPRSTVVVATTPGLQADAAGLRRGTTILTVDGVDLVNDATEAGIDTLNAGLFPTVAGTHILGVLDPGASAVRQVTLTATPVTETPVPQARALPAPNTSVGYLEFDAHIATSEAELVTAFTQLRASGVTDLVLDLRYNGGGYLDIASELAYMIAGPTATSGKAFEQSSFNDKNPFHLTTAQATTPFHAVAQGFSVPQGQALPTLGLSRVFVLTTADTCSASESVVNGLRGAGVQVVLIGGTTCGKPYGFYPQDNCGTTYFTVQFRSTNALGAGDYADGFAPNCAVADDYAHALGDPAEALLAVALGQRNGNGPSCTPAPAAASRAYAQSAASRAGSSGPALRRPLWRENTILTPRGTR